MDWATESLKKHFEWRGKLDIVPKMSLATKEDLSLAYTPGVAQACLEIQKDPSKSWELTGRWNTVAVITDGSAVLGLGDIGPLAGMPVMEGKCALFKAFGGINAFPICVGSKSVDEIVRTVELIQGSFGGINLEDISAPRCFEVEARLKKCCDIPVFHDDQHGTAVVVLAALLNSLKLVGKKAEDIKLVINGAGSAGIAIAKLLLLSGIKNIVLCDKEGALCGGHEYANASHTEIAKLTNPNHIHGLLSDIIMHSDVFVGVSAPNVLSAKMIKSMGRDPVIFAMANPVPEIMPDEAIASGAAIVGSGRSDFANQINNVLAFPGIFRGALDVRARDITPSMQLAAAHAIAGLVSKDELNASYILPHAFDPRLKTAVSAAVSLAAQGI
ncbi:MAG: malate dehydrogenase [Termitinemataceae bacterium]|nr:MAG: malate dehydrogenase [Termitinemataceae bacterium]